NFIRPNWRDIHQQFQQVDVVVNMVGVMSNYDTILEQVHRHTPVQMASMAKQSGVKRWINLSALGANANHSVAFAASKGRGDDELLAQSDDNFEVTIVRPSLVFGPGGVSCEMFIKLARLSLLALPNGGHYQIQPVHVNDVAQGLVALATRSFNQVQTQADIQISHSINTAILPNIINFTGAQIGTLAEYLTMMRRDIHGLSVPKIITIADGLSKAGVRLIKPFSNGMIGPDSLVLLEQGSVATHQILTELLGHEPLGFDDFVRFDKLASNDTFHVKP
ncbi:MAG: hypothetical protein Q4P13_11040, partial [Psychrobacter sp.]|nr:hypothetical protein [Psychrobacter sp.]